jgi:hypothetical protein
MWNVGRALTDLWLSEFLDGVISFLAMKPHPDSLGCQSE